MVIGMIGILKIVGFKRCSANINRCSTNNNTMEKLAKMMSPLFTRRLDLLISSMHTKLYLV